MMDVEFACDVCQRIFSSLSMLQKHNSTSSCVSSSSDISYDKDTNTYVCKKCGYKVRNKSKLFRHLSRKTPCDNVDSKEKIVVSKNDIPKENIICEPEDSSISLKSNRCAERNTGIYRILHSVVQYDLKVLDLFCGCGGMSKGLTNSGLNVIAGIDFWDLAIESYKNNFDHLALCADLTKMSPREFHEHIKYETVDIIVGGPPCQGFSTMGNRDPKDPRNSLFMEFVKYVYYFLPRAFVMENVFGILSMKTEKGKKVIDIILKHFLLSYDCYVCKLVASDYDVPQDRTRVIIIGIRKNLNVLPTKPPETSHNNKIPVKSILLDPTDVNEKYYLDKQLVERMNTEKVYGVHFVDFDKPCNTILAGYGKSGGYTSLVKYSDDRVRKLTLLELKRIQTFPDDYVLHGSMNNMIKQIGNAVPVNLSYHIGKHLIQLLLYRNAEIK